MSNLSPLLGLSLVFRRNCRGSRSSGMTFGSGLAEDPCSCLLLFSSLFVGEAGVSLVGDIGVDPSGDIGVSTAGDCGVSIVSLTGDLGVSS
jgi:hypothetical protein